MGGMSLGMLGEQVGKQTRLRKLIVEGHWIAKGAVVLGDEGCSYCNNDLGEQFSPDQEPSS